MGSSLNMTSIFGTDFVGVLLLLIILMTKGWVLPARKKESRALLMLLIFSMLDCLCDALVSLIDGRPGYFIHFLSVTGNTFLYVYNLVVGICIIYLVIKHIGKDVPKLQIVFFSFITFVEATLLVVNLFTPMVFEIDEANVYHRGEYYYLFILVGFLLILYGFIFYFISKFKSPSLRYFPAWQFLFPILLSLLIQVRVYGISLQPVSFAIAFTGLVICLQNECIYIDKLTGVYNRFELDKILKELSSSRKERVAALMIDLNGFKQINDRFSHSEGDSALVAFADILVDVIKTDGTVIRFAGDEFIVIIRKFKGTDISEYRDRIFKAVNDYNDASGKEYKLSAAVGGDVFEYDNEDSMTFLDRIDTLMYRDKEIYYNTHDRRR